MTIVVSKINKTLPVVLMLVIISTCITFGSAINVQAQDGTPVTFPDSNLEAAIRKAINRPEGPIYATNLESITMLTPHSRNISDLTGLEYLVNLTDLDLRDNQISDISLLASLARLTKLNLSFNQISDISSLASLTNLTALDLSWNEISNLSPLVGLTNLRFLSLEQNNVNDISALVENIGLSEGDTVILTNNPLSATSLDEHVPQLKKRGVTIERIQRYRFDEVFLWIPVGASSTIASVLLFLRARRAGRRRRRVIGLITGLIGAVGCSWFWCISNRAHEFSLIWYSGPETLSDWAIYFSLPLFFAIGLVIVQKWELVGGLMFIIGSLALGGVYLVLGSIWGIFYVPLGFLLLVSGVIHIQLHNQFSSNSIRSE